MSIAIDSILYDEYIATPNTISDTNSDAGDNNLDIDTNEHDIVHNIFVDDTQNQLFYEIPFDSNTEFLFVNHMLSLMHGRLPSYVYYSSNHELRHLFWNNLTLNEFIRVYHYLYYNGFIEAIEFIDIESASEQDPHEMRNQVLTFIDSYFVGEQNLEQDYDYHLTV